MTTTFADRAAQLQAQGHDYDEVIATLCKEGATVSMAHAYAQSLDWRGAEEHPVNQPSGSSDMAVGLIWLVLGIGVTAFTFAIAPPGGSYLIAWGPAVFGAMRFFRGMAKG